MTGLTGVTGTQEAKLLPSVAKQIYLTRRVFVRSTSRTPSPPYEWTAACFASMRARARPACSVREPRRRSMCVGSMLQPHLLSSKFLHPSVGHWDGMDGWMGVRAIGSSLEVSKYVHTWIYSNEWK